MGAHDTKLSGLLPRGGGGGTKLPVPNQHTNIRQK